MGVPSFGSSGGAGAIPSEATGLGQTGLQASTTALTNRYNQLGLGEFGATPGSPGSFGQGSTAYNMDVGVGNPFAAGPGAPSMTGGLTDLVQAMLGQVQTQTLPQTTQTAEGQTKAAPTAGLGSLIGGLGAI